MTEFKTALQSFEQTPNEQTFAEVLKLAETSYQCVEVALAHNERGSAFAARAFDKAPYGNGIGNYLTLYWFREHHGAWWLPIARLWKMKGLSTTLPQKAPAAA